MAQLAENVMLLRRSKEAADQDRKERGIEFDDYLEAMDQDVYNNDEETNVDFDFTTLQPMESSLLHAALAFPGIAAGGDVSSLQYLLHPQLIGTRFSPISLAKTWAKKLKAFKDRECLDFDAGTEADIYTDLASEFVHSDEDAALVPVLGYSPESMASLRHLQASFQADSSIENLQALIINQYPLKI